MKKLPELTPRGAEIFDVWTATPKPDIDVLAAALGLQPASLSRYLRTLRTEGYLDKNFKSTGRVVGGRHGIVVDELVTTLAYTPENNATAAEVASILNAALDPAARVLGCAMNYAREDLRKMLADAHNRLYEQAIEASEGDIMEHMEAARLLLNNTQHKLNELGMRVECLQHAARPVDGG